MRNSNLDEFCFKTWWILYQTRDIAFRIRTRELSKYGITTEQAAVLFIIKMLNSLEKKVTPGEISKRILREPHSVSKILTRMEKDGFVIKTGGFGKNRNEVHITLTEKGEQAYSCSLKREAIQEVMSALSKAECLQLYSLLEKIRDKGIKTLTKKSEVLFP